MPNQLSTAKYTAAVAGWQCGCLGSPQKIDEEEEEEALWHMMYL